MICTDKQHNQSRNDHLKILKLKKKKTRLTETRPCPLREDWSKRVSFESL